MLLKKAFRFRVYPTVEQRQALAVQFGHARFVYNHFLNMRRETYQRTGKGLYYHHTANLLATLKREAEYVWLREADSQVLQQKLIDLDRAYINFFEGRACYPKFKKKAHDQTIRYPQRVQVDVKYSRIYLPKVGRVKIVLHRPLCGELKSVTVSKTKSGKYFASLCMDLEQHLPPTRPAVVGIDLGINHFAVLSNGEHVEHPKYLRQAERRLKRLHRGLSRKQKGSASCDRHRRRLARQYEKVANQRADFLHKLSRRIIDEHGFVAIENLNVAGLLKNHSLAKSIADSGWSAFGRMLTYKGTWYNTTVERVDRFFPSSKMCSACGFVNEALTLKDRFWMCPNPKCRMQHDRDYNSAVNILKFSSAGTARSHAARDGVSPVVVLSTQAVVGEGGSPTASSVG